MKYMPPSFKVKVGKMKYSLWMTIPKEVAEFLEIHEGDTVLVSTTDHTMEVKKKALS